MEPRPPPHRPPSSASGIPRPRVLQEALATPPPPPHRPPSSASTSGTQRPRVLQEARAALAPPPQAEEPGQPGLLEEHTDAEYRRWRQRTEADAEVEAEEPGLLEEHADAEYRRQRTEADAEVEVDEAPWLSSACRRKEREREEIFSNDGAKRCFLGEVRYLYVRN